MQLLLADNPSSIIDLLQNSKRIRSQGDSPKHRDLCELIKKDPTLVGLESKAELFEERSFVNKDGVRIACPDFIAFQHGTYFVVEVGTQKKSKQLLRVSSIIELNFGICPELIKVQYFSRCARVYRVKASSDLKFQEWTEMRIFPLRHSELPGMGALESKDIPYGVKPPFRNPPQY